MNNYSGEIFRDANSSDNNKIQKTILVLLQPANNFIYTIYDDLCVFTYL